MVAGMGEGESVGTARRRYGVRRVWAMRDDEKERQLSLKRSTSIRDKYKLTRYNSFLFFFVIFFSFLCFFFFFFSCNNRHYFLFVCFSFLFFSFCYFFNTRLDRLYLWCFLFIAEKYIYCLFNCKWIQHGNIWKIVQRLILHVETHLNHHAVLNRFVNRNLFSSKESKGI